MSHPAFATYLIQNETKPLPEISFSLLATEELKQLTLSKHLSFQ